MVADRKELEVARLMVQQLKTEAARARTELQEALRQAELSDRAAMAADARVREEESR